MLTKKDKQKIIAKYRTHKNDTGSPEVQIAILSAEIDDLTGHLQLHKKDHSSRRGLLKKVGERRKLLKYLQKEDFEAFKALTKKLKLKIAKKIQEEEERERALEEAMFKEEEKKEEDDDEEETSDEKKDNKDSDKKDSKK